MLKSNQNNKNNISKISSCSSKNPPNTHPPPKKKNTITPVNYYCVDLHALWMYNVCVYKYKLHILKFTLGFKGRNDLYVENNLILYPLMQGKPHDAHLLLVYIHHRAWKSRHWGLPRSKLRELSKQGFNHHQRKVYHAPAQLIPMDFIMMMMVRIQLGSYQ